MDNVSLRPVCTIGVVERVELVVTVTGFNATLIGEESTPTVCFCKTR